MAYRHTTGGDLSTGGAWLKEEGTYHFVITGVDEDVCDRDGRMMPEVAFEVSGSVFTGTVDGQRDKNFGFRFYKPKPGDTEDQRRGSKRALDRLWVATSVLKKEDALTPDKEFDIDLQALVGRQFICKLEKNDSGHLRPWSNFYHVDDEAVAAIPKDQAALSRIPADQRWIRGAKPTTTTKPPRQPAKPQQVASTGGELSDDELSGI